MVDGVVEESVSYIEIISKNDVIKLRNMSSIPIVFKVEKNRSLKKLTIIEPFDTLTVNLDICGRNQ